ncbi:phosphodiester glycosidase family protein [Patescibacteria group bacterium]
MKQIKYILALLGIVLFFGCGDGGDLNEWQPLSDSVSKRIIEYSQDDQIEKIHIYRINSENLSISIANGEPKYISDWAKELDAEIVINGAYFNKDFGPSGYLKINNERIGELIFDQGKSGLIQINNGQFSIRDLAINPLQTGEELDFGLQSFPFLINDGNAAIKEDSGKTARRTALGIDEEGHVYIIFADLIHISLYELMNKLIETNIDFTYVLNLDGGPSSGILIHNELKDSVTKVPSVILFEKSL